MRLALKIIAVLVAVPLLALAVLVGGYYAMFYWTPRADAVMVSGGEEREYLLHVPASLDPKKPAPLVISLHGAAAWPGMQRRVSRWDRLADEKGFIVAYPSGASVTGSRATTGIVPKAWLLSKAGLEKDLGFFDDLVAALERKYRIDPDRIYVEGLSNGGGMAFALSCRRSERIAAIGMVAAAHQLPWSWCADKSPIPMIAFHGTADTTAPYAGGRSWSAPRPFPRIDDWVASWARRNGCEGAPQESRIAADVLRFRYAACPGDAAVVLYRLEGGGHTWPGGDGIPEWLFGPATRSIDATRELWAFFEAHPRRRRPL